MNSPSDIAMAEIRRRLEKHDQMVAAHDELVSALRSARAYLDELYPHPVAAITRIDAALKKAGA